MLPRSDNGFMIGTLQKYVHEEIPLQHLYSPVIYKGYLVTDGAKRKYEDQHIRVNSILNKIDSNSTILDLGCNTGFMVYELYRLNTTLKFMGVDNTDCLINLCNTLNRNQNTSHEFKLSDIYDYIKTCKLNNINYDIVMLLSVFTFDVIFNMLDSLLDIVNDKLFLEPTNHELLTIDEFNNKYISQLDGKYIFEVVTHTDYQNRPLIMVHKNA